MIFCNTNQPTIISLINQSIAMSSPYSLPTSLDTNGVWVFPITTFPNDVSLEADFNQSLLEQPEINPNEILMDGPKVGGGFGAFGHASSFHTLFARKIRTTVYDIVRNELKTNPLYSGKNIEIIPDRQCERPAGQAPTAESWHRDLSPTEASPSKNNVLANADDLILGGWANCNADQSQYFVCVPQTHQRLSNGGTFDLIGKNEAKAFREQSVRVEIPPGHCLVFNQSLVHCVNPTKLPFVLKRIYTAYRVTTSAVPLIPDILERLQRGAVIPLKSGQLPRMYPKMWLVNWPEKLIALSAKFSSDMKETLAIKSKRLREHEALPDEGEHFVLCKYAPDAPPIVSYTPLEMNMYVPHPI
jgi:hypothetical protein